MDRYVCFNHSLHWSDVKEEAEECEIQQRQRAAVSLGFEMSQVSQKKDPNEQGPSFTTDSDIHVVPKKEDGHKDTKYLRVKVLRSPVLVKMESEECSFQPEDKEKSLITVKKEENEDWLKSDAEDVKVTVPWETLKTSSPPSPCSYTEDSEMEGDSVRNCQKHERDISEVKIEDCNTISMDVGTTPDSDEKADAVDISMSSSFYPCPHCALGFTIERFFHGHLRRDHPKHYLEMQKTGEIPAKKKKGLRVTPATCPQCGKSFTNKYAMQTHQRTHTGDKPYHCLDCGKSYFCAGSLKTHRRSHTGERPYKCFECGKAFGERSQRIRHEMTHTGRPHKCSQCDKCFCFFRDLKRHRWTHTSVRPFKCFECGKGFIEQTKLTRHEMIHTGEGPYTPGVSKLFHRGPCVCRFPLSPCT
uniref:C2H2-type domain-containing protein n=1 Tax=Esox lucius TaxID=8010 RepID=A0AAY5KCN7_ESOLU